jgi:hypothetical protein
VSKSRRFRTTGSPSGTPVTPPGLHLSIRVEVAVFLAGAKVGEFDDLA